MDEKPVLCQHISSLMHSQTRFPKRWALQVFSFSFEYPKTFCLTSSVFKIGKLWLALAQLSLLPEPACHQFSFKIYFGSQRLKLARRDSLATVARWQICYFYALIVRPSSSFFTEADDCWGGLLERGRKSGCCALSVILSKHHLHSLFYCWFPSLPHALK